MISRRGFLQGGAALGAGSLMNLAPAIASPQTEDAQPRAYAEYAALFAGRRGVHGSALSGAALLRVVREFHDRPLPVGTRRLQQRHHRYGHSSQSVPWNSNLQLYKTLPYAGPNGIH